MPQELEERFRQYVAGQQSVTPKPATGTLEERFRQYVATPAAAPSPVPTPPVQPAQKPTQAPATFVRATAPTSRNVAQESFERRSDRFSHTPGVQRPVEPEPYRGMQELSEHLFTPVSKQVIGVSFADLVDTILPADSPLPGAAALLTGHSEAETGTVYAAARKTAQLAAGIGDWMQNPAALASMVVGAAAGGAVAKPAIARLFGAYFGAEGSHGASEAVDEMVKDGINSTNLEHMVDSLLMIVGGAMAVEAEGLHAAKQKTALPPTMDREVLRRQLLTLRKLTKDKDWVAEVQAKANQAAVEKFEAMAAEKEAPRTMSWTMFKDGTAVEASGDYVIAKKGKGYELIAQERDVVDRVATMRNSVVASGESMEAMMAKAEALKAAKSGPPSAGGMMPLPASLPARPGGGFMDSMEQTWKEPRLESERAVSPERPQDATRIPPPEETIAPPVEDVAVRQPAGETATPSLRSALKSMQRRDPVTKSNVPDPVAGDVLGSATFPHVARFVEGQATGPIEPVGAGVGSVVLDIGGDRVARIGVGTAGPVPEIASVLQPSSQTNMGGLRVEIFPKVDTSNITAADVATMRKQLKAEGYEFSDAGTDNLGRTADGKLVVTDPGAVTKLKEAEIPAVTEEVPMVSEAEAVANSKREMRSRAIPEEEIERTWDGLTPLERRRFIKSNEIEGAYPQKKWSAQSTLAQSSIEKWLFDEQAREAPAVPVVTEAPRTPETSKFERTADQFSAAEDYLLGQTIDTELKAWADAAEQARGQMKRGDSAMTMESNAEGKQLEEAMDAKARSIRSLGVKEGTAFADFKESPAAMIAAVRKGSGKLYEQMREALVPAMEDAHLDSIREFLTKADEEGLRDVVGKEKLDQLIKAEEDISFDFGENVKTGLDTFIEGQKAELNKLWKGGGGLQEGVTLPAQMIARLAAIGAAKLLKGGMGFLKWAQEMRQEFSDLNINSTDLQNVWTEAQRRIKPLAGTTASERKRLSGGMLERLIETGEISPAGKLIIALERASTGRRRLEREYTKERAERASKADEIRRQIAAGEIEAETGQAMLKSKFKGEMAADKKSFEALKLSDVELKELFAEIAKFEKFNVFDVIAANDGIQMVDAGIVPQMSKIELLQEVFGKELGQALIDHRNIYKKLGGIVAEAANLPRALMASMDLSAVFRQGIIYSLNHPIRYGAPAFNQMIRQVFSPKNFKEWQESIRKTPEYKFSQDSGLKISDPLQLGRRLSKHEERYQSAWAERLGNLPATRHIPVLRETLKVVSSGIRASERGYTAFLNKMRWDVFNDLSKKYMAEGFDPAANMAPFESLASLVNNATGAGELGKYGERIAPALSATFFSPRLIASRFNLFLNPVWHARLHPRVKIEHTKTMLRFVATGTTLLTLASMIPGVTVEPDPRSTDFGKIRHGNTRWDPWGGFQQWARVSAQVLHGYKKTARGDINKLSAKEFPYETRKDVIEKFMAGKLAPIPLLGYELMEGQKLFGGDLTLKGEAIDNAVMMYIGDIIDAVKDKGPSAIVTAGVPAFLGVGVSTYTERPPSSAIHSSIAGEISEPVTDALMKNLISVGRVERLVKTESADILRLRTTLTGKLIDAAVREAIEAPDWDTLDDEARATKLEDAKDGARAKALSAGKQEFDTEAERAEFLRGEIEAVGQ